MTALGLPPSSRAQLADRLLASLDDLARREIEGLWAEEAEDRISAYERGEMKAIPGEEVTRELRSRTKG